LSTIPSEDNESKLTGSRRVAAGGRSERLPEKASDRDDGLLRREVRRKRLPAGKHATHILSPGNGAGGGKNKERGRGKGPRSLGHDYSPFIGEERKESSLPGP